MTLLISYFLLSIIFSFLCSIWEAVLLSITPSYIKRVENESPSTGELLNRLKNDIDKPLSAILTLNTIAHTLGAIGVGAQASVLFGSKSSQIFGIDFSIEFVIATIMTLMILYVSEIIPKTIGANNWKSLASFTAHSVKILIVVLTPLVWLSYQLTKILKKDKDKSIFSKLDFSAMADVVGESGEIDKKDYTLIKNILQFDDLTAKDVMTPRTVMIMAEESQTLIEFYKKNQPFVFSRIPLYNTNKDTVTGVLLKDDLLQYLVEGKHSELLKDIKREVVIVPDFMPLRKIFDKLNSKHEHLALVVDEYGGLQGLVTLEDVIETMFGLEIMDETDSISDLQSYARQQWEKRAKKLGLIK